jgi:hypothetical protein
MSGVVEGCALGWWCRGDGEGECDCVLSVRRLTAHRYELREVMVEVKR